MKQSEKGLIPRFVVGMTVVLFAACSVESGKSGGTFSADLNLGQQTQEITRIQASTAQIIIQQMQVAAVEVSETTGAADDLTDTTASVSDTTDAAGAPWMPLVSVDGLQATMVSNDTGFDLTLTFDGYTQGDLGITGTIQAQIVVSPSKIIINSLEKLAYTSDLFSDLPLDANGTFSYTLVPARGSLVINGATILQNDQVSLSFTAEQLVFEPLTCPIGPVSGGLLFENLTLAASFDLQMEACGEAIQIDDNGEATLANADIAAFFADIAQSMVDLQEAAEEALPVLKVIDDSDDSEFFTRPPENTKPQVVVAVDTVAPFSTILTGPSALTNETSATFNIAVNEPATLECLLDGDALTPCSTTLVIDGLSDGVHQLQIVAIDTALNRQAQATQVQWRVDTVAPVINLLAGPKSVETSNSYSFVVQANEALDSMECTLDSGAKQTCVSPYVVVGLSQGQHTVTIQATDLAGNVSTVLQEQWSVDTAAPIVTLTSVPTTYVAATSATVEFSTNETATTNCHVDGGVTNNCQSPFVMSGLSQGQHSIQIVAIDGGGLVGQSVLHNWFVDTVAPQTQLNLGMPDTVTYTTAIFFFSSNEPGTFECQLDAGGYNACTSPYELTGLAGGSHTVDIRAIDTAGNIDASPASDTWGIDNIAPESQIDSGPASLTNSTSAVFTFSSTDPAGFECKLDAGIWTSCASPSNISGLIDGSHTFAIRARDLAGNVELTPSMTLWFVDTTQPTTTIDSSPPSLTNSTIASIAFSADEATSSATCIVDGAAAIACGSPIMLSGLAEGSHWIDIAVIDLAGNADSTAERAQWTIDTVAPETVIDEQPDPLWFSSAATFEFSSEASATFACTVDGTSSTCTSPLYVTGLTNGAHSVSVAAIDIAGNVDASPIVVNFTVDLVSAPVQPLYAAGTSWMAYVTSDGDGIADSSGLACDSTVAGGNDACIHAAEVLWLPVLGQSSCDNLTAADYRGWFTWQCDDSTDPVRFITTSLDDDTLVADLIDWTTYDWYANTLTVYNNGITEVFSSRGSQWWDSAVTDLPVTGLMDQPWTVYAADSNPGVNVVIEASHVALIVKPGFELDGVATSTRLVLAEDSDGVEDYLWFEGRFDASARTYGINLQGSDFVTLRHLEVSNATNYNVYGEWYIRNWLAYEVDCSGDASNSCLYLYKIQYADIYDVRVDGVNDSTSQGAIHISDQESGFINIHDVVLTNVGTGLACDYCTDGEIYNIKVDGATGYGIDIGYSHRAYFHDITATSSYYENVRIANTEDAVIRNVLAHHNSQGNRTSVFLNQSKRNLLENIFVSNGEEGFKIASGTSNNNVVINVTAFNNRYRGVWVEDSRSDSNVIINTTVAHNGREGLRAEDASSFNSFMNIAGHNNGDAGLALYNSDRHQVINLAATFNGESSTNDGGIVIDGADDSGFYGEIKVGNNIANNNDGGLPDCYVSGATLNAGLGQDCTERDISDFNLTTDVTLAYSFVGKITLDTTNGMTEAISTAGIDHEDVIDWLYFEHLWRGWGNTGSDTLNKDRRNRCYPSSSDDCVIWDFALRTTDTVLRAVLPVPTGAADSVATHNWTAADEAECLLNDGASWDGFFCTTEFLHNSWEITTDNVGNNNGLCESNENCMYSPNIGSYQGHGVTIPAGTIGAGGDIFNVQLFQYSINGR